MKITYTKTCTKIYDSYKLKNDNKIREIVWEIYIHRSVEEMPQTRTHESYFNEIKAHNRLYNLGLFRSHTKDVDLEEPISKLKELIYAILSI